MSICNHEIKSVIPGSIAHELGIEAGDRLISIGNESIIDVLDYRFHLQDEFLIVEIEKAVDNEIWELEIEKNYGEDLGLEFEFPLMSKQKVCCNNCVFCFVDQQPKGLRDSLYVKDDDPRLSFLMGNYVTLTNLSREEAARIAGYHLSPLKISVHAADLDLRCKMMGTERARNLFDALEVFNQAGITLHFQIVLCKGLNDGAQLDYSIETLSKIQPGAESLAIVPVGLTKHRGGIAELEPFTKEDAVAVIKQVEKWQSRFRKEIKTAFVFLADEWYIMAGCELPEYESYEDFLQLDNGVGMIALFRDEFLSMDTGSCAYSNIGIVTGKAAVQFMTELAKNFESKNPNTKITIYAIENNFFGEDATVSGLIVGQDVIAQLTDKVSHLEILFLPQNAFRAGTEDMLDGSTRQEIESALGVPVVIGSSSDGDGFYQQLIM